MNSKNKMRCLGWVLIQSDWCSYKKKTFGHTDTQGTLVLIIAKRYLPVQP